VIDIKVICDRCKEIAGFPPDPGSGFTAGYYNAKAWARFANPGEEHICDSCMWDDPRYIAVYGKNHNPPKEFRYGDDCTIHRTSLLNVETDSAGKVVSVWFRCLALPFDQTVVDTSRAAEMRRMSTNSPVRIKAIVIEDRING